MTDSIIITAALYYSLFHITMMVICSVFGKYILIPILTKGYKPYG